CRVEYGGPSRTCTVASLRPSGEATRSGAWAAAAAAPAVTSGTRSARGRAQRRIHMCGSFLDVYCWNTIALSHRGVPMTAFSPRVVLPVALLVGLLPGCAHRKKAGQDASATPATTSAPGSAVTSEDIQRNPGQPIEQVLLGRLPGVVVTRTAGGLQVRIRGGSSLEGSNVPLYVLDGIIIDPGPNGNLTGINP